MNRRKAILKYINHPRSAFEDFGLTIINEIYDDLESRVCENCRYYNELDDLVSKQYDCTGGDGGIAIVSFPPPDFGCNRCEVRDV